MAGFSTVKLKGKPKAASSIIHRFKSLEGYKMHSVKGAVGPVTCNFRFVYRGESLGIKQLDLQSSITGWGNFDKEQYNCNYLTCKRSFIQGVF